MRASELEESAADELKRKLPSLNKTDYSTIDHLMKRISKRFNISGKKLHDLFVSKYGETPDHWIKKYKDKLDEAQLAGNPIYVIYVDGKPATKYVDSNEAKQDLQLLKNKFPNKTFVIKQQNDTTPGGTNLIGEGEGQGSPTKSDKPSLSDQGGKGEDKEDSRPLDRGAGSDGTGGQIKHNVNYAELRKQLKDRIIKATKSVSSVTDAEQFMSDVNKELSKPLIRTQATTALSNELIDKANKVAGAMLNALAPLAVTADPAWRFRQENGVLDPVSYKTHEPGDSDYWIDYEGEGSTGHSLSVSVLLDTSGSMDAWMDELSVAAYGIRLACDSLEIPCTVSTFDTDAYMLYPHEENVAPLLIHDGGGTNPRAALKQVENQKAGKQRQLVVVLTDGAWSDVKSIKPFVQPGQYWVLTALGDGAYAGTFVEGKGADVTLVINDVAELPKKVEQSLSNFLA